MGMDLMEQICTTIWANKASLLRTLQVLEESNPASTARSPVANMVALTGRISQENLKRTLRSLNASLEAARGGTHGGPLTPDQINILVDHAAIDDENTIDYQAFLDAFEIVDLGAPPEDNSHALGGASPLTASDTKAVARGPVRQSRPQPVASPTVVSGGVAYLPGSPKPGLGRFSGTGQFRNF